MDMGGIGRKPSHKRQQTKTKTKDRFEILYTD